MPNKHARHWTAEQKLGILEEGRQAGSSVAEVCRRHQVGSRQFYLWEKQAKQGALQALRNGKRGRKPTPIETRLQAEVERLRKVVCELSIENLQVKKGGWS